MFHVSYFIYKVLKACSTFTFNLKKRSHKKIQEDDKKAMEQLYDFGIPLRCIYWSMANLVGSIKNFHS